MNNMNWRKGFFRVCIVLACLWTLPVLCLGMGLGVFGGGSGLGERITAFFGTLAAIAAGWGVVFAIYWTVIWVAAGFGPKPNEKPKE